MVSDEAATAVAEVLVTHIRKVESEFKNFHRLLCERFGYAHDPVDWKRDQLSLIEHIASQSDRGDEHG